MIAVAVPLSSAAPSALAASRARLRWWMGPGAPFGSQNVSLIV